MYEDLKSNCVGSKAKRRRIGAGRKPLSTDLELNLFQCLEEERAQGRAVTNLDLSRKAIQIARELSLHHFRASPGWRLSDGTQLESGVEPTALRRCLLIMPNKFNTFGFQ